MFEMTEFSLKPSHNRHTEDFSAFFAAKLIHPGSMINETLLLQNLRFIGEEVW